MKKNKNRLLFRFAIIFMIFTFVALLMSGLHAYYDQMSSYKKQKEDNLQQVAEYLRDLIMAEGDNFLLFQEYFLHNRDKMMVRYDFSGDYQLDKKIFEKKFAERYPGKTLGVDVNFLEMPDELQNMFANYYFEYWLYTFEKARDEFGMEYTYYLIPSGEHLHMIWTIDLLREKKVIDGIEYIDPGVDVYEPIEEHMKMWEAWNTGLTPKGYDTYDNEYGKTYAFYLPLFVNGKKIGVIGTEVAIEAVNQAILENTLKQLSGMSIILILCVICLLWFINKKYILKLVNLQGNVRRYALDKNVGIAGDIEREAVGHDEIAALSMQIAAMILELESYMNNLVSTAKELSRVKEHAHTMNELAHKDALTGIGNKAAYDIAIRRLEWSLADENLNVKFAIAMIDLNFLKRINDTYGHEHGNMAIIKLCELVCNIFKTSEVFRIGGDEFVVILEGMDYENADLLVDKFNDKVKELEANEELEPWESISASIGLAVYDPEIDHTVENVFKRADKAMYARKKAMKAMRE